jgi:GNAT superfamily N-acetyltransferase
MAGSGHVKKMARDGEARPASTSHHAAMHSRYVDGLTIRPLRSGDTETVRLVFERLGEESRRRRFGGAKPRLSDAELAQLALLDRDHHVLVGYLDGDRRPAGLARLVRRGRTAEVAFEVADECQGRGIGSALARALADDARAAGIVELHATVTGDRRQAASLLRSSARVRARWSGGECALVAALD